MSNLDPRNMPASEEPLDLGILDQMKERRHFAFKWSGGHTDDSCGCKIAPCGFFYQFAGSCPKGHLRKIAAAKQAHWSRDCPETG